MINIKNKKDCCGCYGCFNVCPKGAIKMVDDECGFNCPVVDMDKCVDCGLCNKVCPVLNDINVNNNPRAFACFNKNDDVRLQSSSGGVFSLIAECIIKNGGIVFGAMFNEHFDVVHSWVDNVEDLYKFRGSKYVQSSILDSYKKAKEFLDNDRYVLFSGTPCQVEGLSSFLRKSYEKLYTQDFICHGVPSPRVWKKYLEYLKNNKSVNDIKKISFRDKSNGWKNYNFTINYFSNKKYTQRSSNNIFMQAFLQDLCLRDSCYDCKFKKINRVSDITLADFWGIENVLPKMDDNKGTSLFIVNSNKGNLLFNEIKDNIEYKEVELEQAIKYNPSMIKSCNINKNRDKFFDDLDNLEFDKLVRKYSKKQGLLRKVFNKFRSIIKIKF